jgi:alpha-tubulin suppressor-like RCC1 family protein
VYSFGDNRNGEWGNGTYYDCLFPATCPNVNLRQFHALDHFNVKLKQLAAGAAHLCALADSNEIWCWGYDSNHSVAPPELAATAIKVPPEKPELTLFTRPLRRSDLGHDNKRLLVGGAHSCVEKVDGSYWCWGSNFYGQLADSTRDHPVEALAPFKLPFPAPRCPVGTTPDFAGSEPER